MLQKQNVAITFQGGVDTKTDSKMVMPLKLTELENGVFVKGATIQKRNGYTQKTKDILGAVTTLDSVNKLSTFKDELLALTSNGVYSYAAAQDKWVNKGFASSVEVTSNAISSSNTARGAESADGSRNGNYKIFAWVDGTSLYASVQDLATGNFYLTDHLVATLGINTCSIKCAAIGTYLVIIYNDNGTLKFTRIDTTNPVIFSVPVVLAVNAAPAGFGLLDVATLGATLVVAYIETFVADVNVLTCDSAGLVIDTFSTTPGGALDSICICIDAFNSRVFVTWNGNANGIEYTVLTATLTVFLATTLITGVPANAFIQTMSAISSAPGLMKLFYSQIQAYGFLLGSAALDDYHIGYAVATDAAVITLNTNLVRGLRVYSKPFAYGGEIFVLTKTSYYLQSTYYLIDSTGRIHAKSSLNEANGFLKIAECASNVMSNIGNSYSIAVNVATRISGGDFAVGFDTFLTNYNVSEITFIMDSVNTQKSVEINNNTIFTGGYVSAYDGGSVTELGFNYFPFAEVHGTVAGNIPAGTYNYQITYEWIDNQGTVHRSAPLASFQVVTVMNSDVNIYIPTYKITQKTDVQIVVYRTTNAGTVYYRLPLNTLLAANKQNPRPNDPSVDYILYVDSNIDSTITGNESLYTTGGVVENIVPPACKEIEIFKNRVILSGLEDSRSFWYSKTITAGIGTSFNDAFFAREDGIGGPINYCRALDDKLIIFKDNLVFGMFGDGPLDTGQQNNFSTPQLISSDVGSTYPSSCVLMPNGLVFKTDKGIYLLDRALRVSYIGAEVESSNSQTITKGTLLDNKNQIRFLTDSGSTLVYDYYFNQWSTFTNFTGKDSVNLNGVYRYLRNDSRVWEENATYTDNSTAIVLKATTAWLKTADIQGFQRVQRYSFLGNYYSPHILTVKVGYDYKTSYDTTMQFNTTTGLVGGDTVYQFRGHIDRQKSEAIRFQFYDTAVGAPGRSYDLNNLMLQFGVKAGLNKQPPQKSIG